MSKTLAKLAKTYLTCPNPQSHSVTFRYHPAFLTTLTILYFWLFPTLSANEALLNRARTTITDQELSTHIEVLADDSFEGREAGTRGGRAAAKYLLKFLERDLQPIVKNGGYVQSFNAGYRNLLGVIEGNDPELKNEYLLVGAHYDHVGYGNSRNSYGPFGQIHNGADDNASGVSALLEVMDAFATTGLSCKRSIIFAFWDGEEKGLLGSEHWAINPSIPLDQVKLAINVDMIGHLRNNRVEVYGARSMRGLRHMVTAANAGSELKLDYLWEINENSDHHSFHKRQIPVLMFHTGLHDFYHRPIDDAHLINAEGVQQVSNLLLNTLTVLGNEPSFDTFRPASRYEGPGDRSRFERPLAPGPTRLGLSWNAQQTENGLRVLRVRRGLPADLAKIRSGDILLELNGIRLDSSATMSQAMVSAPQDSVLLVQKQDSDRPEEVAVRLIGQPTRLGITWRADIAESKSVNLVRVVPHSPAARAGLQLNDRILEVNGERFKDSRAFRDLVFDAPLPVTIVYERQGQMQSTVLEPSDFSTETTEADVPETDETQTDASEDATLTTTTEATGSSVIGSSEP